MARCKVQELKVAVAVGGFGADIVRIQIFGFNAGASHAAAFFVEHIALNASGRKLRLPPCCCGIEHTQRQNCGATK